MPTVAADRYALVRCAIDALAHASRCILGRKGEAWLTSALNDNLIDTRD